MVCTERWPAWRRFVHSLSGHGLTAASDMMGKRAPRALIRFVRSVRNITSCTPCETSMSAELDYLDNAENTWMTEVTLAHALSPITWILPIPWRIELPISHFWETIILSAFLEN